MNLSQVKIRYCRAQNTWIVLVNGIPKTFTNVIVEVPVHTTIDKIWDRHLGVSVEHPHMSCESGDIQYKGDVIIIK